MIPLQKIPKCQGVGLNAIGAADDQHRAVQNPQSPLHLGRKVRVARGVHQREPPVLRLQYGLLGENGNPPLPFQRLGVQKGIPVIHPPQAPPGPALIQQRLRKRGLPRIHMGK